MPAVRKYRRDTSEVSCCLKYVIFGFNVMFWVSGTVAIRIFELYDYHTNNCRTFVIFLSLKFIKSEPFSVNIKSRTLIKNSPYVSFYIFR